MTIDDFAAQCAAGRAIWQKRRQDLLARAERVRQALHQCLGPLVVMGDEHVSEEQLLAKIASGEGPMICGCTCCLLKMALPSAVLDAR